MNPTTTTLNRPGPSPAFTLGLVLTLAALPLCGTPLVAQADEPTADELIEKNLEAKGGREAVESVESARIHGTMNMGGMEAPFVYEWKAPDKVRIEFTVQGMTGVQAYDGEMGWMLMPFMGKTEPEKMSPEDAAMIKEDADFRGPLFDPESKGWTVEYGGEVEVEGTPTYRLDLTKESGESTTLYLDQEYYLEIKQENERTVRGQQVETETAIGDFKQVGELLLPHSHDMTSSMAPEGQGSQTMTFEQVELNPEIPDERFAMPEGEESGETEDDGEEGGR